jgi:predicted nucleic acid-binding protein
MKLLFDTNVLVAAVTRDSERSGVAIELLNFCRGGVPFLKKQRSERSERVAQ